jgi:peptidoglycan/LPS O-acetylase OafA/YrhL
VLAGRVPVALPAATLFHRLVEAPSRELARRVEDRLAQRRPPPAGAPVPAP